MEKVTESTTFFKAIDGTKFFSEEECDRYERERPEEILDAIWKELTQVSYELSYYKEWVLPGAEKNFEESKARLVKRRNLRRSSYNMAKTKSLILYPNFTVVLNLY